MGEDSPPSTPTSEVRAKETSSQEDKSTNEVQKSAGPPAPQLARQSQLVQSVMQDCQYVLSNLLPVCNSLVQGPKIT